MTSAPDDALTRKDDGSTASMQPGDCVDWAYLHADLSPETTRRREIVWQDPLATLVKAAGLSGHEYLSAIMTGTLPPPPIGVTCRLTPIEVAVGRVQFSSTPTSEFFNAIGSVSGGYAATLLDTAMATAVQTTLAAGDAFTSLTLEVKMVRPITSETGDVMVTGTVTHRGRRQAVASAEVVAAESGKLLASGTASCIVMEGELLAGAESEPSPTPRAPESGA